MKNVINRVAVICAIGYSSLEIPETMISKEYAIKVETDCFNHKLAIFLYFRFRL